MRRGPGANSETDRRSIVATSSLLAKRSNPEMRHKRWIASSLSLLAMTIQFQCYKNQCNRNSPSIARISVGRISRAWATVTE